jgi:hypothetical protein
MRQGVIACVMVIIIWGCAALIWPLTGTVVPWDSKNHFYPMFRFVGDALANGEWPLWNPYHFSGHPASSDPQSLLFSPLMMLLAWISPQASMSVFDAVVFAHLLIGGLGIIAFFGLSGWRWEGAVLAAIIFMFGGSASGRLQHTGMILSYGFLPVALTLLHMTLTQIRVTKGIIYGLIFGLVAGIIAIGRDQVAYLSCLMLIAYALYLLFCHSTPLKKQILPLFSAGIAGCVVLLIPALLTLQLLEISSRPAIHFGVAAMGSLPPQSLLTLLWADVFGSLRTTFDDWGPSMVNLVEGTWTDRSIQYLFAGTVPILLTFIAILNTRIFDKQIRFFAVALLLTLTYMLGWYTPVFEIIFDTIPGVNLYRRPADASFILNFLIAILAGYMLHVYIEQGISPVLMSITSYKNQLVRLFFATIIFIALSIALIISYQFAARAGQHMALFKSWALFIGLVIIIVSLLYNMRLNRHILALILVAITMTELVSRHSASALNGENIQHYAVFDKLPDARRKGIELLQKELDERRDQGERPRVEILGLGGAWQNAGMVFGIENTLGYNPLRLSHYQKYVGIAENAFDPLVRQFPRTFRGYTSRLASLLGIEYLVLSRPLSDLPEHFPRPQNVSLLYESTQKGAEMWIYRLPPPAPRAYFATKILSYDPEMVSDDESLPAFDLTTEALVDVNKISLLRDKSLIKDESENTNTTAHSAQVALHGYRRNAVALTVDTTQSGVLVLHDIWFPGWQVEVNGERRPILKMNALFRGVELEAGHARVIFTFRPFSHDNLLAVIRAFLARSLQTEEPSK